MDYGIVKKDSFKVAGVRKTTRLVGGVWNIISVDGSMERMEQIAGYGNVTLGLCFGYDEKGYNDYMVGFVTSEDAIDGYEVYTFPESEWLEIKAEGKISDNALNNTWEYIHDELIAKNIVVMNNTPTIEDYIVWDDNRDYCRVIISVPVTSVQYDTENKLNSIAKSYDLAIDLGRKGINQYDNLPDKITSDPDYKLFLKMKNQNGLSDSGMNVIRKFLSPAEDMKFVDIGCCLNLMFRGYDSWPSLYHGIDISSKTIELLNEYVGKKGIEVGSLYCGSMHKTPYENDYFDIGACIGSLEYFKGNFVKEAVAEANRIIKPSGRFVLDVPDVGSREFGITMLIEEYLGRPDSFNLTIDEFENILIQYFEVIEKEKAGPMLQYFLVNKT